MTGLGIVHFLDMVFPGSRGGKRDRIRGRVRNVTAAVIVILCAVSLVRNIRLVDKSDNRLAYYFGMNFLNGVEHGAFALTKSWDLYSPVIYLQVLEGVRPDVTMVDYELMRRSWYVETLSKRPLGHSDRTQRAMNEFRKEVVYFEKGEFYDASSLEARFREMLNSLLADALERGSVYVDYRDEVHLAVDHKRVPHLMAYRLSGTSDITVPGYESLLLEGVLDPEIPKDERTRSILERYTVIAVNRGIFLIDAGLYTRAAESMTFALGLSPENLIALKGLAFCLVSQGREKDAREFIEKILRLNPEDTWAKETHSRLIN
jgi:tetratricopeptide (TPR) repeat protein